MYLPKSELLVYFLIYLTFVIYSIYEIVALRKVIYKQRTDDNDFIEGWKFLDTKRDNLDFEWELWKGYFIKNIHWFIIYVVCSEIIRHINVIKISYHHAFFGFVFLFWNLSFNVALLILLKIISFYVAAIFGNSILIWVLAAVWLGVINLFKLHQYDENWQNKLNIDEEQFDEVIVILSWMLLKCISFSIDKIKSKGKSTKFEIENFIGYSFYFPTLFFGPFMIYGRYKKMLDQKTSGFIVDRLRNLLFSLIRIGFWVIFCDFALHYIYMNNLLINLKLIESFNGFQLYGLGYLMGLFFYIKYICFYGIGTTFAQIDGIETPKMPKCIGRIHLYSDMWKNFDQGLYEFLFLYIYTKLCKKDSSFLIKLMSSFFTFTFIYLWHGLYDFVLIWTILNYICLILETFFTSLIKSTSYTNFMEKFLTKNNLIRLNAFFGIFIFIPSAISNFYFLGGLEVGHIFIRKTLGNNFPTFLFLLICCYCVYHTSEFIKRWQMRREIKSSL